MTTGEFIQQVAGDCIYFGKKYDVLPSLLIAQTILESNSGNSLLAKKYNNLTGMKAQGKILPGIWAGEKTTQDTTEFKNGVQLFIPQDFRRYNSWKESIEDLAHRYSIRFKLTLTKVGNDANKFLAESEMSEAMKTGYATDPQYKQKIENIIAKYNLKQFDHVQLNVPVKKKASSEKKFYYPWGYHSEQARYYTV